MNMNTCATSTIASSDALCNAEMSANLFKMGTAAPNHQRKSPARSIEWNWNAE